jgi:hypothetical protein
MLPGMGEEMTYAHWGRSGVLVRPSAGGCGAVGTPPPQEDSRKETHGDHP